MAKIELAGETATFNPTTYAWECPDVDVAELLQAVLEHQVRSVNECMHVCATRYGANVLEWDREPLPLEQLDAAS